MDAKLLAKIALRVLAVYMIAKGIMELPALMTVPVYASDAHYAGPDFLWIFAAVLSPLIIGLGLWFLATRAANWVVGSGENADVPMEVSGATLLAVAFISIGVVFVVQSLPNVLGLIYASEEPSNGAQGPSVFYSRYFLSECIRLILGLVLMAGTRNLVRLFHRFREFGLAPASKGRE